MKRVILRSIFILLAASPVAARAAEAPPGQIAVSPSLVELSIDDKPVNGSIRMQNLKKEPISVKVEVYNWTLDEQNKVKLIPGDNQSLDQWLLVSPIAFSLEPGSSQVIRYSRASRQPKNRPGASQHPGAERRFRGRRVGKTGISRDRKSISVRPQQASIPHEHTTTFQAA